MSPAFVPTHGHREDGLRFWGGTFPDRTRVHGFHNSTLKEVATRRKMRIKPKYDDGERENEELKEQDEMPPTDGSEEETSVDSGNSSDSTFSTGLPQDVAEAGTAKVTAPVRHNGVGAGPLGWCGGGRRRRQRRRRRA